MSTDAVQSLNVGCPFATGSGVGSDEYFGIDDFPLVLFLSNAPDFLYPQFKHSPFGLSHLPLHLHLNTLLLMIKVLLTIHLATKAIAELEYNICSRRPKFDSVQLTQICH